MDKSSMIIKAASSLPHFHWTITHYHQAIESGVLNSDHKLELLFGKLVARPNISPLRAAGRNKIRLYFVKRIPQDVAWVMVAGALTLSNDSEPEPDLIVIKLPEPTDRHPNAEETLLVVEVSDGATLARDRRVMSVVYATSGIVEYWIINIEDKQIERYTEPVAEKGSYTKVEVLRSGDTISSLHLGDFAVADIAI